MNPKKKNIFILIALLILLIFILQKNSEVKTSIILGTELWLTKVFPSLFPMFILSDLLMHYHLPEYLANHLGPLFTKLFKTSSYGVFTLFMSLIAGTPSSAYILKNLVNEQKITTEEASHLLQFTFFSNPLFLLTMLKFIFPNQNSLVIIIISIHYLSNLIIGLLIRPKTTLSWTKIQNSWTTQNLGTVLSSAIQKAMNTLLLILGTICFYLMLSTILTTNNSHINLFLKGFLELTQGLNSLINTQYSTMIKGLLSLTFISFGGLSIHTQIKSIIEDTSISYLSFLKGRILHVLISILLFLFLSGTSIAFIS
ncbi:MAG: hypothetical protein HFI09_01145 [Bacilli bacterium]|nr:hypothetical protein [Bacilli bacterium]